MTAPANPEPDRHDDALTIHELAERVGMTVRNLREWRTLGLLPRAELRGRVGYYPPAVVERVERIQRLRREGFTLELIRRMLEAGGDAGDDVMQLAGVLRAPFREGEVPVIEPGDWGMVDSDDLRRAAELGLVRERQDGGYEFTTRRIAEVAAALRDLGLTIDQILDAATTIRAHAGGIAELFEQVWLEHVWEPFLAAGRPETRLPEIQATAERVPSLALDAVVALFTVAMEAQIERGIARELARAETPGSPGATGG